MTRRAKWIFWTGLIVAFAAYKIFVSPTDAELYEKLQKNRRETVPTVPLESPADATDRK